jgi:hypothetical protein
LRVVLFVSERKRDYRFFFFAAFFLAVFFAAFFAFFFAMVV